MAESEDPPRDGGVGATSSMVVVGRKEKRVHRWRLGRRLCGAGVGVHLAGERQFLGS